MNVMPSDAVTPLLRASAPQVSVNSQSIEQAESRGHHGVKAPFVPLASAFGGVMVERHAELPYGKFGNTVGGLFEAP